MMDCLLQVCVFLTDLAHPQGRDRIPLCAVGGQYQLYRLKGGYTFDNYSKYKLLSRILDQKHIS